MLQNGFLGNVLVNLPNIKLSDLPNLGITGGMTPPSGDPVKQDAAQKFGSWLGTGTNDTKLAAKDLMNRNLMGADQLVFENQDTSNANAIRNMNQSDWKVAAIQNMLGQAYKAGIRTPEAVTANWPYLTQGKWSAALNDPTFSNIHKNFPDVFKKLLADQWVKQDALNNSLTAKK